MAQNLAAADDTIQVPRTLAGYTDRPAVYTDRIALHPTYDLDERRRGAQGKHRAKRADITGRTYSGGNRVIGPSDHPEGGWIVECPEGHRFRITQARAVCPSKRQGCRECGPVRGVA